MLIELFIYLFIKFIYFERENMNGGGAERGRNRIPSRLCTFNTEPGMGLELTNREIMTRAEIKRLMLNQLNHPGAPEFSFNSSQICLIRIWVS